MCLCMCWLCSVLQARVEKGSSFNHWIVRGRSFRRHTALFILSVFHLYWHTAAKLKICPLFTAAQGEERECAFTDQQQQWEVERMAGGEGRISPENTTVRCGEGRHCFGLWEKSPPGEVRLVKQGMRPETWSWRRWKLFFILFTSKSTMCCGSFREDAGTKCEMFIFLNNPPVATLFSGCWAHVSDRQSCRDDRCVVTNLPPQIQNGTYHFCCCSSDMCNVNFTEDFAQPSPTTAQPICKAPFKC